MTHNDDSQSHDPQPRRPNDKRGQFSIARTGKTNPVAGPKSEPAFTLTTTAILKEGATMDNENRFILEMVFKPNTSGLKLRPEETQLLFSYWSEILREIEEEEKKIIP